MSKGSSAPDPVSTATAQQHVNQVNQSGPFANLSYSQTGTNSDGTPQMTATSSLSPQLQSLYDQVGKSNPALDPSNLQSQFSQQQGAAYSNQMNYLQPQFDQQTGQLKDQLQQQGITQESNPTAYANAMQLNNNQQGFSRQQALDSSYSEGLAGENQQFNQGVTESNLPISQLSTLFGLSNQNGQSNGTTLAQLAEQQYAANNASANNTENGLFSLGSTALMAYALAPSDRRIKRDVTKIGERRDGIGIYSYRYVWDDDDAPLRTGVMAQEVEKVIPHAVMTSQHGFKIVNYAAL